MNATQLAEMARRELIARLQAEVASGEETKRKLEAQGCFGHDKQGALVSSSSANSYQIAIYESTPSTTQIVLAEEEQRSSVNPNANWLRNSKISITQSVTPSYNSNYQYQTLRSYPASGQKFTPAQSRPQVPALAHQRQQRQVYPSQPSTPAQTQQRTQLRKPPQSVRPSQLLQTYSQQPQRSFLRPSSLQISIPAPATQSQSQLHSLQAQTMNNNHQARGTTQGAIPLQTQTSSTIGQQSATRELTDLNQAPLYTTNNVIGDGKFKLEIVLENPRIGNTDSFVICVQIHCPVGPSIPAQPVVYYVPKDLLDGIEGATDTGDVQFVYLERLVADPPPSPNLNPETSPVTRTRHPYPPTIHQLFNLAPHTRNYWVNVNCLLLKEVDDPRAAVEGVGRGWSAHWLHVRGGEWDQKKFPKHGPFDGHTTADSRIAANEMEASKRWISCRG
ncbi:hypothetical protein F5050DRAFT_1861623 [Lentinula boryana]|uniref:Uncharacterized protein n=1 Tax=Lentinula boryana TaxID=40481 RepID=A0ABQ8Q0H5_9AGAR|nr:hypothetical protein F5050DRAFT_1861623 [Lentinula boryana]